jgi:predicted Zn-dependent protease with MMP-like domain
VTKAEQERFDRLLQDAIDALPERVRGVIEEVPVIVMDKPDRAMLEVLKRDGLIEPGVREGDAIDLMGLHSGIAITEQSVNHSGELPPTIHVFREALVEFAGGWDQEFADEEVYEEIRITLLHEIGHHFGLDEDDLDRLGYG